MPKAQVIEHKNGSKEVRRKLIKSISGKPMMLMYGDFIKPGDEVILVTDKTGKKGTWELAENK